MAIRDRPGWMSRADYHILEGLAEPTIFKIQTPTIIAYNLDYTPEHVQRRLSKLSEHDLVERVDRGRYEITEHGRAFIDGDLDADKLER